MSAGLVTKTAQDASYVPSPFQVAFFDMLGNGSQLSYVHALVNSLGALIDPASSQDITNTIAKLEAIRVLLSGGITTTDKNGAAFGDAVPMTSGTVYPAGRSVGVFGTNSGTISLTLTSGRSISLPIGIGWQTFPFAATQFSFANGAAGTVSNLV